MEAVNAHLQGVKPLFDQVSINVVELAAQFQSGEGSQIAIAINEKHRLGEIVFLGQLIQERSGWICAPSSEDCDIENQPRI